MPYSPHTESDRAQMLKTIGVPSIDELFSDIPQSVRADGKVQLPKPLSEPELFEELLKLSEKNQDLDHYTSFLGAGAYNHFIPAAVKAIISRSEFYTAYTPYQAEISQGILQAIYEYQTMICNLTGMDIANASMYDGGTALAEAANVAVHHTGRKEIVVSQTVHPEYRAILKTYGKAAGWEIVELSFDQKTGLTDLTKLTNLTNSSCLILQQPNFFGCLEDVSAFEKLAHAAGTLYIVSVDPISLGILKSPGDYGANIVVGEGQSLGLPLNFGGPYLGIFAAKEKFSRLMPGRIVGATTDHEGKRGYCLTLQTREQHIRREKALSNICSNEALCALAATVYLALMGKQGLKKVAELCLQKANYLKSSLATRNSLLATPTFKEFVFKADHPISEINKRLLENGIIGGLDLERFYPQLKNHMLIAVTELTKKEEMDKLVTLI